MFKIIITTYTHPSLKKHLIYEKMHSKTVINIGRADDREGSCPGGQLSGRAVVLVCKEGGQMSGRADIREGKCPFTVEKTLPLNKYFSLKCK